MPKYQVKIFTSNRAFATTVNSIFIKLDGENGESPRTNLSSPLNLFQWRGGVATFCVECETSFGKLVMIELDKKPLVKMTSDDWFPSKVEIKSPEGDIYSFPIYRWIDDNEVARFREGKALKIYEDKHPLGRYNREKELKVRAQEYRWSVYAPGIPHCLKVKDICSLPAEVRFSFTKDWELVYTYLNGLSALGLCNLSDCEEPWTDFESIWETLNTKNTTEVSDYVQKHWDEDEFFGYQFLNGVNPMLIKRCTVLPENFPVPVDKVLPRSNNSLCQEMKKGNVYLCDYKNLKDLKANVINGKQQYLTAPLVLLFKTPDDKLVPVAIQLNQTPGADNPIFYPSDSKYDWLTAKTFVRSADFTEHQLNVHLLRTHLLAEAFSLSLLRNLPMVHPLYKLLIPHTRYTFQINFMARNLLISPNGVFTKFSASGGEATLPILQRSLKSVTYSSLCVPDNIAERGMGDIPNYYYRDDALRLWEITFRFVDGVVKHYYKNDSEVERDSELQFWIGDIFEQGFLSNEASGIPKELTKVADLVKFVTMVIFTCSFQHAAVNTGQYDFGSWMPNTPITLQQPPPTTKDQTSEETLVAMLPDQNTTAIGISTMWLLSKQSSDFVKVGYYPEKHFVEDIPGKLMDQFAGELAVVDKIIDVRNTNLELKYEYLKPQIVENSVSI